MKEEFPNPKNQITQSPDFRQQKDDCSLIPESQSVGNVCISLTLCYQYIHLETSIFSFALYDQEIV